MVHHTFTMWFCNRTFCTLLRPVSYFGAPVGGVLFSIEVSIYRRNNSCRFFSATDKPIDLSSDRVPTTRYNDILIKFLFFSIIASRCHGLVFSQLAPDKSIKLASTTTLSSLMIYWQPVLLRL